MFCFLCGQMICKIVVFMHFLNKQGVSDHGNLNVAAAALASLCKLSLLASSVS